MMINGSWREGRERGEGTGLLHWIGERDEGTGSGLDRREID
jgi:hypothetical protein